MSPDIIRKSLVVGSLFFDNEAEVADNPTWANEARELAAVYRFLAANLRQPLTPDVLAGLGNVFRPPRHRPHKPQKAQT